MITITYNSPEYHIIKAIGKLTHGDEVATYNGVWNVVNSFMNGEHFHEVMADLYDKRIFFIFPHGHINAHRESFVVDDNPVIVLSENPFDVAFDGALTIEKLSSHSLSVSIAPEVTGVFDIAKMVFVRNHSVTYDEFFSKFHDLRKSDYAYIKTELMRDDIDGILDIMIYCHHVSFSSDGEKEFLELNEFWNGSFGISYYSPVYDTFASFLKASSETGECSLQDMRDIDVNNVSFSDISIGLAGLCKNSVLDRCGETEGGLPIYKRGARPITFYGALDIHHTDDELTEIIKNNTARPT